jgi:FkbM family methyltransferase
MSLLRPVAKACVATILVRGDPVKIVGGPLRGWYMPRSIAKTHLAMLCGRHDPVLERAILKHAAGSKCAYDIGANIGYVSLLFAAIVGKTGRVYAFEPSPGEAKAAEMLMRANNVDGYVTVQQVAVCDTNGQLRLAITGTTSMLTHLAKAQTDLQSRSESCEVQAVTLDSFVKEQGHNAPDFIKIDVETAEASVLEGGRDTLRQVRPRLVIEMHGKTAARQSLALLFAENYRCFHLTKPGETRIDHVDQLASVFRPRVGTTQVLALP